MKSVPAHHQPEIQVAIRMARILAEAGLVHPVADHVGEMDVMDWAAKFVTQQGTYLAPAQLDRAQYSEALKDSVYQTAMHRGWVVREERDTRGQSPGDIDFKQAVATALRIQNIPAHVPRSAAHRALFDATVKELQKRALHYLRVGGIHKDGEISFETDGRFEKLKLYGVSVASCSAGERDKREWMAALESNLGIRVKPGVDHQVMVTIDGEDIACTASEVRVQVFNDLLDNPDEGVSGSSMTFTFTSEGTVTDHFNDDEMLATSSVMYDELVASMQPEAVADDEVPR